MRCPKCHYISFDDGDRCRNCGYELSLTVDVAPLDLPIQTGDEATGPLADLRLSEHDAATAPGGTTPQVSSLDVSHVPHAGPDPATPRRPLGALSADLPLFSSPPAGDDRPLVTPAVPRAPLSVRRANPAMPRPRARPAPDPHEPVLALEASDDEPPRSRAIETPRDPGVRGRAATAVPDDDRTASLTRRVVAGAVDAAIVLGIDAAVVYFTLQLCGLRLSDITVLPPVPFLAFVLLLNGGYFSAFVAAGGQTIGKMAAGIRVVPHQPDNGSRVPFGYAVLRAAAYLVSVLPAGLGWVPALLSADRRTLHDRLAETRVVRI
jgi:uncharacterized RDD family membrane protein YckC